MNACTASPGRCWSRRARAAARRRACADRDQARPRRRARLAVPKSRRRIREARQRQARRQGEGRRVRLEPARRRQGDAAEAQARHPRHGAAVDGDVARSRTCSACSRCRTWSRTARTWRRSRRRSSGRSSSPRPRRRACTILAVWENGYRHITNSKRPIKVPADLKGIKLRVPEGKWRVKMFQAYGANPSPMKFSEVFTALQTGVMDGQENPFTQIYSAEIPGSAEVSVAVPATSTRRRIVTVGTKQVGDAAGRRAQDPRGHREGNAGLRLRAPPRRTTTTCSPSSKPAGMQVERRSTRTRSSPRARRSTRSSARKCRARRS